jgi:predicted DNA-binding transcriptional regulator YafY
MPVNRNALIRYKTIDKCLQNHYRQWTLEDLIEACSEALYEYEGILKGISKRTVQLDIQLMRSDKLGYNAPIIVFDNKYYTYEDRGYSITNIPLTDKDLGKMSEAVEFMKQFKGFSHFRELDGMIQKLEDHVYSQKKKQKPVIDFEKNENLKGLEFLDVLYQSIIQQRAIRLTYQSFRARQSSSFDFHPYLLKEFRNRWFLLGIKNKREPILNLALDRIIDIHPSDISYIAKEEFNAEIYFKDVIGVSVSPDLAPEKVVLFVTHKHAKYVITKPFHSSQRVIGKDCFGITIELTVQHNFELEKEILGLGEGIMVIAPERLKRSITGRLNEVVDLYNTNISEKEISTLKKKLENKGFAVVNNLYTKRALRQIGSLLHSKGYLDEKDKTEKTIDLKDFSNLKEILVTRVIDRIVNQVSDHITLKEIIFSEGTPEELFELKQSKPDAELSLLFFLDHPRIASFQILAIPGSNKKYLSSEEQSIIVENCAPAEININPGGGIFMKSLLIHQFHESLKDKKLQCFTLRWG